MQFQHGEHHWLGATLAADEINAAGGIQVGNETYQIKLVQVDSNELVSVADAASAAERAITVDNVDFLMGTIRSEAAALQCRKSPWTTRRSSWSAVPAR